MRTGRSQAAVVALPLALSLGLGACATTDGAGERDDGPAVVVTTAIMGDLTTAVIGDHGHVEVVVEGGSDPHTHALSARQRALLGEADLVVANGLGLESSMAATLEAVAAAGVPVVEVGPHLDPRPLGAPADHDAGDDGHLGDDADAASDPVDDADGVGHDDGDHAHGAHDGHDDGAHDGHAHGAHDGHDDGAHGAHDGHDHGALDAHVWLDPVRMADAGAVVARALSEVANGPWQEGADAWSARMHATHDRVSAIVDDIPDRCRLLVTTHDALGTFAQRYDFTVVGTIVTGGSTDALPSAAGLARLVDELEVLGAPAVFVEDTTSPRTAETLARELGDTSVHRVPIATIGGDGPATLDALLTTLAEDLAAALRDC